MPALHGGLSKAVQEARCCGHWHVFTKLGQRNNPAMFTHESRSSYPGLVFREEYPHCSSRLSHPRRRFGVASGRVGAKPRKIHRVRDQIVVKSDQLKEPERLTRWLCGAFSWQAELLWDADEVCAMCEVKHQGKTAVRIK